MAYALLNVTVNGARAPATEKTNMSRTSWVSRMGGVLALVALSSASGCAAEPCSSTRTVDVDEAVTPFEDGKSVFSVCERCPEMPPIDGVSASGPATGCSVIFYDSTEHASVICLYGLGHDTTWSGANEAVLDVPNEFGFCEQHCPDEDAFHGCSVTSSASGVEPIVCSYGQSC